MKGTTAQAATEVEATTTKVEEAEPFVCIDMSGSTGSQPRYWQAVEEIAFKSASFSPEKAKFVFWDTSANKVEMEEAKMRIILGEGGGGTDPHCFIPLLEKKKRNHLILITDGQVGEPQVQACDALLAKEGYEFSKVDVHFIQTGGPMNLSVSAPFTRNCEFRIFVNGVALANGSTAAPIDLEKYQTNPLEFLRDFEELRKMVVVKTMGRMDVQLRTDLLKLQQNLLSSISKAKSTELGDGPFLKIRGLLPGAAEMDDLEVVDEMKNFLLTLGMNDDLGKKVEAHIQDLVRLCDTGLKSNFSFDLLRQQQVQVPGRIARAEQLDEQGVLELDEADVEGQYECPISFATDLPCLLINRREDFGAVLEGMEKSELEGILNLPLVMLNAYHKSLVDKLATRLDHVVGLSTAKDLFRVGAEDGGVATSPYTRNPIDCALTFGKDPTHDKANNFTLSNIFFGDKKLVGCPEMWLCVVYFTIAEKVSYLNEDKIFMEEFRQYIAYRLQKYKGNLTMSGLPIEPLVRAPLDVAVWYCVASPRILVDPLPAENRLRSNGFTSTYLCEILETILGYKFNKVWTLHQISLYSAFSWMMRSEKEVGNQWRKLLRAQYQASLVLPNGFIVMLDGPANPEKENSAFGKLPNQCQGLSLGELLALEKLCAPNKAVGDVPIPNHLLPIDVPKPVRNYGYSEALTEEDFLKMPLVQICPKTFRPYSEDRRLKRPWREAASTVFGCDTTKMISLVKLFQEFVFKFSKFPESKAEFIEWVSKRQENREKPVDTLPSLILIFTERIFLSFEEVLGTDYNNVSAETFNEVVQCSMHQAKRVEMENF